MIQLKAFQIFSTFNKDEFTSFGKFIISPYFNNSKELIKLYKLIKPYHPEFNDAKLAFEKIYKKLYPDKKFNEGTVRNLFSGLGSMAEKFLAYINYENSFDYGYNIIAESSARYLDKEFQKNYKKYFEINKEQADPFLVKNLNQYFLESVMCNYTQNRNGNFNRDARNSIYDALFAFFLTQFLSEQSCQLNVTDWYESKESYNIVGSFFKFTDVKALIEIMEKNNSPYYEDVKLFYYISVTAQNKSGSFNENFEKAYELFKVKVGKMTKNAQLRMYVLMINIINMNIKAGDINLSKIKFTLGKEMIDKGIVLDDQGKMAAEMFSSIIHNAIVAGEINWAKEFLENKIDFLDDETAAKANMGNYYKAKLLSCDKKYLESNEVLLNISKDHNTFKADSKILRLINYYELGYIEAGFSHAEAFKQLLIRNDEANIGRKELSSNFLKFYLSLLRMKAGADSDISFVKKELEECKFVKSKTWLIEKFAEWTNLRN